MLKHLKAIRRGFEPRTWQRIKQDWVKDGFENSCVHCCQPILRLWH